jgi:hypothetical protein
MANKFYDQVQLQDDYLFQKMIESASVYAARNIVNEGPDVERTTERKALAREVIETSSVRRQRFLSRMFLEASLNTEFQEKAVVNGRVIADAIPANDYEWMIGFLWNAVMDATADIAS